MQVPFYRSNLHFVVRPKRPGVDPATQLPTAMVKTLAHVPNFLASMIKDSLLTIVLDASGLMLTCFIL